MSEPTGWITVRGNRVPLFEGESKSDAVKRFAEGRKKEAMKRSDKDKVPSNYRQYADNYLDDVEKAEDEWVYSDKRSDLAKVLEEKKKFVDWADRTIKHLNPRNEKNKKDLKFLNATRKKQASELKNLTEIYRKKR